MLAILGINEIWIILAVVLLLFGHRLPGMARALGSSIVEFKHGLSGEAPARDGPSVIQRAPRHDHAE